MDKVAKSALEIIGENLNEKDIASLLQTSRSMYSIYTNRDWIRRVAKSRYGDAIDLHEEFSYLRQLAEHKYKWFFSYLSQLAQDNKDSDELDLDRKMLKRFVKEANVSSLLLAISYADEHFSSEQRDFFVYNLEYLLGEYRDMDFITSYVQRKEGPYDTLIKSLLHNKRDYILPLFKREDIIRVLRDILEDTYLSQSMEIYYQRLLDKYLDM